MPKRDRSSYSTASRWLNTNWPAPRGQIRTHVTVSDMQIAELIYADRRAERARVRRIVRRECEAIMDREQVNAAKAHHAKRELVATCREAGEEVATECRDRILAALREGKGAKG